MGAIVSAPLACLGSCAGSCGGFMCCKAVSSITSSSRGSKLFYMMIVFLTAISSLLVRYQSGDVVSKIGLYSFKSCTTQECFRTQAAFRICMAMFFFFLVNGIGAAISASFHYGFAAAKLLLWFLLIVASFLVNNDVIGPYVIFSQYGAGAFLLLQIMLLIIMSYDWNASWTADDERPWLIATLAVSAILWLGSIVVSSLFYYWFGGSDECAWQQVVITINIFSAVVYTLLALSNLVPHGTILTSSVMFAYETFTLYGALTAEPSTCSRFQFSTHSFDTYGLIIAAVTLCWSSFSLSRTTVFGAQREPLVIQADIPFNLVESQPENSHPIDDLSEEDAQAVKSQNIQFHVLMALSALYMTMAVSNWNVDTNPAPGTLQSKAQLLWVSLITTWTTTALYVWTLIAPIVLPNRDFGN